jgi:hypothetical protein
MIATKAPVDEVSDLLGLLRCPKCFPRVLTAAKAPLSSGQLPTRSRKSWKAAWNS